MRYEVSPLLFTGVPPNLRPKQETVLSVWMKANGISPARFSRMVGCSQRMVEYWRDGRAMPTLVHAFLIEKVTKGAVPVPVWLGTDLGKTMWRQLEGRITVREDV